MEFVGLMKYAHIFFIFFLSQYCFGQLNDYAVNEIESTVSEQYIPYYHKARLSIETNQFGQAIEHLDTLLKYYPACSTINFLAGICTSFDEQAKKRSITLLKKCYDKSNRLDNYNYWLAKAYEKNDSIVQAKKLLKAFIDESSKNKKTDPLILEDAKRSMENLKMAEKMKNYMNVLVVKNIGPPINTEASEYVPLLSSDQSFMVFTYRGKLSKGGKQDITKANFLEKNKKEESLYFEDVFISEHLNDSTWSDPKPIKSVNTALHDAAVTISQDGTLLFIYKNFGKGNGDLYLSKLNGNVWSVPVYQKGLNSDRWDGSAAFFPDNKRIIFSSERKGGLGGKDLFMAELIGENNWGNIVNMGKTINTGYDEDAPFITADGKTLFFASNGKLSTGGYDILRSDLTPQGWSAPYNIGKPVNTVNDDKFYIVTGDEKKGYYSSFQEGGYGEQDIYCIQPGVPGKPTRLVQITGNVTHNGIPVESKIQINSLVNKNYKPQVYQSNSFTGKFLMNLPSDGEYELVFSYKNLPKQTKLVSTMEVDSFVQVNVIADFYSGPFFEQLQNKKDSLDKFDKVDNGNINQENFISMFGNLVIQDLYFKIQIGAYKFTENFDYNKTMPYGKILKKVYNDGITRFTIGNYSNFNDAFKNLKLIKETSIKDAFIVAIYKNEYYYMNNLLKIEDIQKTLKLRY